jgi:peptidoglycan/LPS O-acetylase OafA/YrhL
LVLIAFPLLILIEYNSWSLISKCLNRKIFNALGGASLTIYVNQSLFIGFCLRKLSRVSYFIDSIKFLIVIIISSLIIHWLVDAIRNKLLKVISNKKWCRLIEKRK